MRITNNSQFDNDVILSLNDKITATKNCIQREDYAMAFLLSKGNKDAEKMANEVYLKKVFHPDFHNFFQQISEKKKQEL